ncbi:MAG: AAA family ATPase [Bacilli bacterium]|nr:AAA family ATPase [Bacilli bacterium]
MKKLILVCGPAAIGKSTWSEAYAASHPEETVFIIAADEVRKDMFGGYKKFPPNGNMMVVYEEMIRRANALWEQNEALTLLLDTTMLTDERRLFFLNRLACFEYRALVLLKLHDYRLCLERNKQRPADKWVPEEVILDMASHYYDPSPETAKRFNEVAEYYVD